MIVGVAHVREGPTCITIQSTGQNVIIKKEAASRTENVVYIVTCSECGEQYIGETCIILRRRINFIQTAYQ